MIGEAQGAEAMARDPKNPVPGPIFVEQLAPMKRLPTELRLKLLHSINELSTLWSLVQTSPLWYDVFMLQKTWIVTSTLERSLPPILLQDALAVHSLSLAIEFPGLNWAFMAQSVHNFIENHWLRDEPRTYPSFPSREFNQLSQFHIIVERVANDLCETALHTQPLLTFEAQSMTADEKVRAYRGFYRFELFCKLFKTDCDHIHAKLAADISRKIFLSRIAPWEIEELACIHSYLHGKLRIHPYVQKRHCYPLYTQGRFGSSSDISRDYLDPIRDRLQLNIVKELYMFQGLDYVYGMMTAKDADKLSEQAHSFGKGNIFLGTCLQIGYSSRSFVRRASKFSRSMTRNDILGPAPGWLWANSNRFTIDSGRADNSDLREWGYCLWAQARLQATGVTARPRSTADHQRWREALEREGAASSDDHERYIKRCREVDAAFQA